MTKKYFRDKGVKFKEVDISRDAAAARDMVKRPGQMGVPVVDIGGKLWSGLTGQKSINI